MRTVLHVDMDAFYAAIEQRDHPQWRGRPLIVGARPGTRGVVATCSYEARAFGVRSAMSSQEAYRRCPHAIFVPSRMAHYEAVSQEVFAILGDFSPLVEVLSIDEAFIDVSGAQTLFGSGYHIAQSMRQRIQEELGLTASVGIAHNKFLAKLASVRAKPNGIFEVTRQPDELIAWLGALPVEAMWGVGQVTGKILRQAGLCQVADLQRVAPERLAHLVGQALARQLKQLAMGEDQRPVEVEISEKSISREHTFSQDCDEAQVAREVLLRLVDEVGQRLRHSQHLATVGRLKIRWSDFRTITRQAPFNAAVCDDFTLRDLAARLYAAEPKIQPIRLIGFGVTGLTTEAQTQLSLFPEETQERQKRERLCHTLDALRARLGDDAIGRFTNN